MAAAAARRVPAPCRQKSRPPQRFRHRRARRHPRPDLRSVSLVHLNQEQFGVQTIKFGGSGSNAGRVTDGSQAKNLDATTVAKTIPDIDLLVTGTLPDEPEDKAPGLDQQPFPAAASEFEMVHVANGRAMIQDDTGLWIVQRGSVLPDSSRVSSIEQRAGKWVIVTTTDKVIALSR